MVRTTSNKQNSRTFQGQKLVFEDSVLFTKSTFLVPLLTLKTLNSVTTYLVVQPSLVTLVSETRFWKARYRNKFEIQKYNNFSSTEMIPKCLELPPFHLVCPSHHLTICD